MKTLSDTYKNKLTKILEDFKNTNLSNSSDVLMWFYKVNSSNIIFEDPTFSNFIYDKLKNVGYSNNINITDERTTLVSLMSNSTISESDLANNLISLIMLKLRNHEPFGLVLSSMISVFNETYNEKNAIEFMMENLSNHIGERVVVNVYSDGNFELLIGKIDAINGNSSIIIDGEEYMFNANNRVIKRIATTTGRILYNDSKTTDYKVVDTKSISSTLAV